MNSPDNGVLLGLQRALQVTNCESCRANIRALASQIAEAAQIAGEHDRGGDAA